MTTQSITRFITAIATISLLVGVTQARATESQTLNAGWLLETARTVILTNDPWAESGCVVEVTGAPYDITVYRDGRIEVVGVLERVPSSLRDIGAVSIEIYVGGALYMRYDPTPYLVVSVRAYTAANDLERGDIVNENDVVEILVDVRTLPSDDTFNSLDEIIGQSARMNINDGRIFTDGLLEPPTLVYRRETVLVYILLGSASVTLHGIALDSGALGEEIRVKNPDSNTIITAVVTGPSRAEVNILN